MNTQSVINPTPTKTGLRILVVDDDASARKGLEKLLREDGFVTSTAENGEAALGEVERSPPDVVLTDLRMQPVNGIELCQRLRAIRGDLPILVMTAYSDMESVIECMRAGADDYLVKPLHYDTVVWCVQRAVERHKAKLEHEALSRAVNEQLLISCVREQEHAETEALHHAQLTALLAHLSEGVIVADGSGRIVMINEAALAILGVDAGQDVTTLDALSAMEAYDLEGLSLASERRPLARALRGEQFADYEIVRIRNGERRHVVSTGTCVRDEHTNVELAIVVLRDVTDIRRLERQREEYLALVSHDLRNPLTSILGFVGVLKIALEKMPGGERLVEYAERAKQNAHRMMAMLEELTEAMRLEAHVGLDRTRCDLRALVRGVVDHMDDARARRITIDADDASSCVVLAELPKLERVVQNLLTNALKYSNGVVRVRLTRSDDDVELAVIDQGIGIAPESLKRLFERYFRTDAGKARTGGLGLGLYITRLIVEAHGGRIDVSSEVGTGSRFNVLLPAAAS